MGIAQSPHPIHRAEEIALHLLIHPVVAAADGDQQILRPHELRYLLSGGTQGSGAHAAAGQREDVAIHRKIQRTAGLLPALRMQELLPNGDAGGEEPLLRQSGGHELRDQVPVGDAQSVHLQIPHTGRAGEVRGHEVGGDADAIAAAQLRHHHGGEQVDADHGIRRLVDQFLIQGADAPDTLLIEQAGGVLLLPAIACAVNFGGIAIGKVVAVADEVGRGLGQELQGVIGAALHTAGLQLLSQRRSGRVVSSPRGTGEQKHFHTGLLLVFSASFCSLGRL